MGGLHRLLHDGYTVAPADESPQDAPASVHSCVVQISQSLLLIYVADLSSKAISLVRLSSPIGSTHCALQAGATKGSA